MDVTVRVIAEGDSSWKYELMCDGHSIEAEIMPDLSGKPSYLLILARPGFKKTSYRRRKPTLYGASFPTREAAVQGAIDWMRIWIGHIASN
jgi:hypothetical protein